MPEVDLSVIGKKTEPVLFQYTWKDVVLYALGVGVSADELSFVYENAPGGLKVLPSFCVVPAIKAFPYIGENIDYSRFLHGEHKIRLSRPIPPEGEIVQVGEVTHIYDKGKAAVYHVQIAGETKDGRHLYDVQWISFYAGAGGFGGDPGPKSETLKPPDGVEPDFCISYPVAANQAAIYRLSGDLIVTGLLDGDVARLKEFGARFTDVVYPGDTLTTQGWKREGQYIIQVKTERAIVMSNAVARVK
jgi:hypothetical protein